MADAPPTVGGAPGWTPGGAPLRPSPARPGHPSRRSRSSHAAFEAASTPTTGLRAQLCGDAHLTNFGLYATPERRLVFGVNDFDETLPGPWVWDVKCLGASVAVAGRTNGFDDRGSRRATVAAAQSCREHMTAYSGMGLLEVWYSTVEVDDDAVVERQYYIRQLQDMKGSFAVDLMDPGIWRTRPCADGPSLGPTPAQETHRRAATLAPATPRPSAGRLRHRLCRSERPGP